MGRELLPRGLKKAIEWLEAEPARPWRVGELAALCGVAPRTLQKHFHRFLDQAPLAFLRDLRFDRARRELLRGVHDTSITEIATRCGFVHLGRFAIQYRRRYGESPSETLRRSLRANTTSTSQLPLLSSKLERPAIAILPFENISPQPNRTTAFADEIAAALWRLHWFHVVATPNARYRLYGKVREDAHGSIRVIVRLLDALTGRHLWAATWDGDVRDPIGFEERVARGVARAIQPALRDAEIDRAAHLQRGDLTAWELTMRALPCVTAVDAAAEGMALELLEEAMERAPHDPLPIAAAAWCRGLRAGHHFTARPESRGSQRANWPPARQSSMPATHWQKPCWQPATRSRTTLPRPQSMPTARLRWMADRPGRGVAGPGSRHITAARAMRWRSSRSRAPWRRPIR
jgi:AraC-like DNA-binding protein